MHTERIAELMETAAARRPADLIIRGVDLVNVHIPRIEPMVDIAVNQGRIASVGPGLDRLIGAETKVIDGQGLTALPGMIDSHTHLDSIIGVREFARHALLSGNTTVATEAAMVAGAAGIQGVAAFMAEASDLPLRVYFLAPPLVPPFPKFETSAGLDFDTFSALLERPEFVGVGETYWRPALDMPPRIMKRFAEAKKLGKTLEGHAAGARGDNLMAYRAGGIMSCHESTNSDEALERLALGMAVQIREGYIRSELPAMEKLAAMKNLDTRRLILCTDQASPEMLLKTGVMNELVRRAVAVGFNRLTAIQMVTLNPADHFGLRDLGRLSPGALADIVLVDGLDSLNPQMVLTDGRVVVEKGQLTVPIPDHQYPEELLHTFQIEKISPADFKVPAPSGPVKIRAVAAAGETITKEEIVDAVSVDGEVRTDPENDLVKIAMFNKHSREVRGSVGFARGMGFKQGAAAVSLNWDSNNLFCVGVADEEMALAANRLLQLQGGLVVVKGAEILAELPLPVAGIISEKSLEQVQTESNRVEQAVKSLGSTLTRPFLTFQTFCFTGLPFLRLTDKGLVDVRKGCFVDLFVTG